YSSSTRRHPPRPPLLPYTTLFRSPAPSPHPSRRRDPAWPAPRRPGARCPRSRSPRRGGGGGSASPPPSTPCSGRRSTGSAVPSRSEEHTSELQSHLNLVCRLLLEK